MEEIQHLALVKIKSDGAVAEIFINNNKVNGVIGYEIVHDRTRQQIPILKLTVQCELDIETGMVPELPEPWNMFYTWKA